ncbi:MAG: SDR family NAD(P)-dependent oxidoreductase [Pseudomonadota bacterium]
MTSGAPDTPTNDNETATDTAPKQGSSNARVVVITGASRGIGYALGEAFGATGAHVVAVARTVGGLEELDDAIKSKGGSATLVPFDMRDGEAIDRLGLALYERFGRVDVLVGNAGQLGTITPLAHLKPKVFDEVMEVNVTANFRLLRSFDPLLRQSEAGRAVFLTSGAAHSAKPFWGAYGASKAALELLVRSYANEMASTSVRANLLNPGPIRTAMRARAVPGEDPTTVAKANSLVEPVMRLTDPGFDETGKTFDVRAGKLVEPQPPA